MEKAIVLSSAKRLNATEQKQIKGGTDNNFWVCVGFRPVFPNHGACKEFCFDRDGCEKQVFE